ncbi:carbon-nitrogen hydrolase family protein [Fontisphaera persica]|uniref:carbon-nitrogen hydrolase family protein n=1 Tax=Fontisphaera persica TaxID=2974023 RepID=UPI0024BF9F17|nr:carbon-nitrogen hydrolase family protein [Fontisphaera persica]WCJ58480.1 carbon-nitrogen hydrolase family protein [Fontisphaera persica]
MKTLCCALLGGLAFALFAGETVVFQARDFDSPPEAAGWRPFSPRDETRPLCTVARRGGRSGSALQIASGGNLAAFGGWRTEIQGLTGGAVYQFSAWCRTTGVPLERRSVIARLEWQDARGRQARPPDYAIDTAREGRWMRMEYTTRIPTNATAVKLELALAFAPNGVVWWDDVELRQLPAMPQRPVRLLTVYLRPRNTGGPAQSVEEFCRLVEAAKPPLDLVCLPEGITVIGTGKTYAEVSETVPGPTTERLGRLAQKLRCYVVAGLYERVGHVVYNTAVLVNREGRLVGKYRKTHLPREEWEAGITPGNEYPVFTTDFGRVGLIICYDLQFPEPSRAMAARGAEILVLPIWGGSDVLARARAIENSVYLISATYDMRSFIVDPTGAILAEATPEQPVARADIDLEAQFFLPWNGNMKTRTWKEWRPDLPITPPPPDARGR